MLIIDECGAKKENQPPMKSRSCHHTNGAVQVAPVPLVFSTVLERFILETINGFSNHPVVEPNPR
jgi:hypothetical protein